MLVTSNLQWPETIFHRPDRLFGQPHRFVVALDIEWTKNYKIKNGSRPFCYSMVLLSWPPDGPCSIADYPTTFGFKSVYVTSAGDESDLITSLDRDLQGWLMSDSILTGHQLSSDLSVIQNAADGRSLPGVQGVYDLWRTRQATGSRVFDTRYDVSSLPLGHSRRLVDVCANLKLDVVQPELARASMTKLQNEFLVTGEPLIREQILTLNVRHSLSTAMVACLGMGLVSMAARNVNDLLHQEMWDLVEYVSSPPFERLLA